MALKFITAAEAASHVKHGDNIGLSGFTPAGTPKAVTMEIAKIAESKPSPMAQAVLRAATVAVWELGIPPVPKSRVLTENFCSLKNPVKILRNCARSHADIAEIK